MSRPRSGSWRLRRSAYPSGRKEIIGFEPRDYKQRKSRKVLDKSTSALDNTEFKGVFRWKHY